MRPLSAPGRFDERRGFRPGELAVLLRVKPETLRQWSVRGLVPFTTTGGGHRRYHRQHLGFVPPEGDPQLLTVREAAGFLAVHPDTLRRALAARALYSTRLPGGSIRLWRSDITTHIANGIRLG